LYLQCVIANKRKNEKATGYKKMLQFIGRRFFPPLPKGITKANKTPVIVA
jgi:hypothetical protein